MSVNMSLNQTLGIIYELACLAKEERCILEKEWVEIQYWVVVDGMANCYHSLVHVFVEVVY